MDAPLPDEGPSTAGYGYAVDVRRSDGAVSSTWWQESRRRAQRDHKSWDYGELADDLEEPS